MSHDHSTELVPDVTVDRLAYSVLLASLTAVLAQVSIPLPGIAVPFSLQPFAVFFAGILLGPLWGGTAMLLYFLVGLAGLPIFSNGGAGLGYIMGPTGGFLVGFVLAAVVIGAIAHRRVEPRPLSSLGAIPLALALLVGLALVYAIGVPWLAWAQGIPVATAASVMVPFVPPDLLKAGITVGALAGGNELLDRR